MSDEIKAAEAAKRFRANPGDGSNYTPRQLGDALDRQDATLLASLYLAEHPADDGEDVTEEWLESVGWRRNRGYMDSPQIGDSCFQLTWCSLGQSMLLECDDNDQPDVTLPHIKTRGDVRRLCEALGIELKEGE